MIRFLPLFSLFITQIIFAGEILTPEEFSRSYVEKLQLAHRQARIKIVSELEVSIETDGEKKITSYLDNAFKEYTTNPDDVVEILQTHVQTTNSLLSTIESENSPDSLIPIIKTHQYLQDVNALLSQKDSDAKTNDKLYFESLNSELIVVYAFDSEKSLSYASHGDVSKTGKTNENLREFAIGNLKNILPDISIQGDDSLSMIAAGGNFEASLILFDEIWSKKNFNVKGDIVIFLPARDVVLVTGSQDKTGLDKAQELVQKNDWSHPISLDAFIRKNESWTQFKF